MNKKSSSVLAKNTQNKDFKPIKLGLLIGNNREL